MHAVRIRVHEGRTAGDRSQRRSQEFSTDREREIGESGVAKLIWVQNFFEELKRLVPN